MRYSKTYIILAAALLGALVCSCRRERVNPDLVDRYISVETDIPTKGGFITPSSLKTTGTRVKVYDNLTGFTGTYNSDNYTNASVMYIDDVVEYGTSSWEFSNGNLWQWTRTGTHNFFGWLEYDASAPAMSASAQVNPSFSSNVLSIPAKTLTTSSDQFDFLYSKNMVVRPAAERDYSAVTLNLAHLFSAIAIDVVNNSNEPITLKSISLPNLPVMNGSATIDYTPDGRTAPVVTYNAPTVGATLFFSNPIPSGGKVLAKKGQPNNMINAYTGEYITTATPHDYKLLWPLGSDILSPTRPNPYSGVSGNRYETSLNNPADSLIRLSYSFTVHPDIGEPYTLERNDIGVKIPDDLPFEPGKKTYILLTLNDKVVDLTFVVQDWVVHEMPLDFSSGSVTVTSSFTFDDGTYAEKVGTDYYIDIAQPLTGRFKITNPVGARIYVAPVGDAQYFNISINHDIVDPKVDMGEIVVSITPNTTYGTPTSAKRLSLSFYVVNGTQEISINSEVRCEGTIIWSN